MSKMKQIVIEIEERLVSGQSPEQIAKLLNVPLNWITEVEMDMDYSEYTRVCEDPDY